MRARGIALLAAAAVVAVSLGSVASASGGKAAATIPLLRVRTDSMYGTLNPGPTLGCYSSYCSLFYERLFRFDLKTGKMTPGLALSVTNPSRQIYIYHLRHGVKFWDGNEMTADDVANSLNFIRFPKNVSSAPFVNVKSVTALDKYTVEVTLKHPDASWAIIPATFGVIFEKKFQQAHLQTFGQPGTGTMATGPFEIDSFNGIDDMELSANPHWWGGKVNIQHVSLKLIADDQAAGLAVRSGAIDVAPAFGSPRTMTSAVGGAANVTTLLFDTSQTYISMNVDQAPFSDVHVRRAIAYATDRAGYIAVSGGGKPLVTMITPVQLGTVASPPQVAGLVKSLQTYPYSVAKAKAELAKSKYPNGFSTTIDCSAGDQRCQVLAGQLTKIGINAQVKTVDNNTLSAESFGHTLGISVVQLGCIGPDPAGCIAYELGGKGGKPIIYNFANYDPPGIDTLMQQGIGTLNPAKRFAVYAQILKRLSTDVPYVPIELPPYSMTLSKKFTWPSLSSLPGIAMWYTPWILNIQPAGSA
jgi:peptide/nickel transport system substrate-binding protein